MMNGDAAGSGRSRGHHASAYLTGTTRNNKRSMPSADNELALCSNLAHLDLRRGAESLMRQQPIGGSIGSVGSTASTASSTIATTFAEIDSIDDDGSVNYGRMRKRRRHCRSHNAYGSHDFHNILQSLFHRDEGNQPSTMPTSSAGSTGAEGAPASISAAGNLMMDDLASPLHF